MSIICQNFVQNAWKKDLCSNCFKSVGDHEMDNCVINSPRTDITERYVTQSTNVFSSIKTATPHTTWKSLISERSTNNAQLFKLENGFQGKLLTINKASQGEKRTSENGKQSIHDISRNGHSEDNGHCVSMTNANGHGYPIQNGKTNGEVSNHNVKENIANGDIINISENKDHQNNAVKYNGDNSIRPAVAIHSILKKTVSFPANQDRRNGSSVGFRNEEPIIIGYGGRDFSPEELEWDSNSSDIDSTSDILDETEDDKVFTKMTKKNTEFNSDNTNLLENVPNKSNNGAIESPRVELDEHCSINQNGSDRNGTNHEDSKESIDYVKNCGNRSNNGLHFNNSEINNTQSSVKMNEPVETDKNSSHRVSEEIKKATAEAKDSKQVKYSGEILRGTVPFSSQILGGGRCAENKVVFSDEEDRAKNHVLHNGENNEWRKSSRASDTVLQAINTSLTNRHKMNAELQNGDSRDVSNQLQTTSETNGDICHLSNESKDTSTKVANTLRENVNVEPRTSFLHGTLSCSASAIPSAIYGPASDLFVSRSDSSSSEELRGSEACHSISVTVNGQSNSHPIDKAFTDVTESETDDARSLRSCVSEPQSRTFIKFRTKPKIPAKPFKQSALIKQRCVDYLRGKERRKSDPNLAINTYDEPNDSGPRSISLVEHYAEANIYHEVDDDDATDASTGSRLAALAAELEQARYSGTKRQAPAPPRIPDPPTQGLTAIRNGGLSSSSSTSSQDTETSYGSWSYRDDSRRKSKSSFLQTQYSKYKTLALDGKAKKFSLKKLLKIGDQGQTNQKAWKYSDDRPRAKLDIIHPTDLENQTVTVNPGFDSALSSFSASADDVSLKNSLSSDYGSFYSDTALPSHDPNYECLPSQFHEEQHLDKHTEDRSNSPTPSRSSTISQVSTLTSGSSKNGEIYSPNSSNGERPPKPPPPPRDHSLLPGSKVLNPDGTFKFPVPSCNTTMSQRKPEAPKRQCKGAAPRVDTGVYDNTCGLVPTQEKDAAESVRSAGGGIYGTILDIRSPERQNPEALNESNSSEQLQRDSTSKPKEKLQTINVTVKTGNPEGKWTPPHTKPILKNRPPPIYVKPQIGQKTCNPWKTLEDSYSALAAYNRELLNKLSSQALLKRKNYYAMLQEIQLQWPMFEIDASSAFTFGEKVAYHATMPDHPEYSVTLVVSAQQSTNYSSDISPKYPVLNHFVDYVPNHMLCRSEDNSEPKPIPATVWVLNRSTISTVECFLGGLPEILTENIEKEFCYLMLQLIHFLKALQAQGIESIEPSFENWILVKSRSDEYHTLVFLSDHTTDDNDLLDSCKVSLCEYALLMLYQTLGIESKEEFIHASKKFSSETTRNVFRVIVNFLNEERAVSLSQTKTLLECFLWDVIQEVEKIDSNDVDNTLQRWFDIKRANYIKKVIEDDSLCDKSVYLEHLAQFLARASIRNIKEMTVLLGNG